uniref:Putative secreted protein n=1 Tax=Ixodes ricinus TaxID=34613 RepID=A0A6B0ULR7_IXORI
MWGSSTRTRLTSFFTVGNSVSASSSTGVFPFGFFAFFFWESGSSDGFCGLYALTSSSSRDPGTLSGVSLSTSPVEALGVPSRPGTLVFSVPGASKVPVSLKTSSGEVILKTSSGEDI